MFPESFMKTETQKRTLFWIYNQQYDFAQNSRYTPIYQWTSCSQFSLSRIKLRGTQLISAEIFRDRGQGSKVVSHPCHPNWSENRRPVFLWKSPLYPIDPMVDSPHIIHVSNFFTNYLGVFPHFHSPVGPVSYGISNEEVVFWWQSSRWNITTFVFKIYRNAPLKQKLEKMGNTHGKKWEKMGKIGKSMCLLFFVP